MDITALAQLGVGGLSVYLMYKIAGNHIDHNTKVLSELKDAIIKLTAFLDKK